MDKTPDGPVVIDRAIVNVEVVKAEAKDSASEPELCPDCGEDQLIAQDGCKTCAACGGGACSI